MLKALWCTCVFAVCAVSAAVPLAAQEIIHALTGTVSAIDTNTKTMTVFQDDGSKGVFKELSDSKTRIAFDKRVAADTTAANSFDKQGAYAIVFYFGTNENRTVVALKTLGPGPFSSTAGTITKFDAHSISVTDNAGASHTFTIDAQTVGEGNVGVVNGARLQAQKGDHVRVVSTTVNGNPVALFVRDL